MVDARIGLSTKEALARLCSTMDLEIAKERERLLAAEPFTFRFLAHDSLPTGSLCLVYAIASSICCILLLFGTFYRQCSLLDQLASLSLLTITVFNIVLSSAVYRTQRFFAIARATNILKIIQSLKNEENFEYEQLYSPASDAILLQWTYRDSKLVNVPWMLLVSGDVIEIRPGQAAPCRCVSQQGDIIDLGDKPRCPEKTCPETYGVIPTKPTVWEVVEAPVVQHLRSAFRCCPRKQLNLLNSEIVNTLHFSLERCLFPISLVIIFALYFFRYFFAGESFVDILVNGAAILIPLLGPMIPMYCLFGKIWNVGFVLGDDCKLLCNLSNRKVASNHIFVDRERKKLVANGFKAIYHYFKGNVHASPDFVFTCGGLTSCAFLDKKGLLSCPNATVEKVLCFHSDECPKKGLERKVTPKVLDLTMDGNGSFDVHFDDPAWERYKGSLISFGIISTVNGCSLLPKYSLFLDHISAISEAVPNTVAVANRRCLCSFTQLLGIKEEMLKQFNTSTTKTIGIYKRLPGEGSDCELFRTPLENAFMTITEDAASSYHHMMSEGTAELLLNSCSRVWCENSIEPYTQNLQKRVLDFYQRNTMTGFCLVLGYRTLGCTISDTLSEQYIDVPVIERIRDVKENSSIPRTMSLDLECLKSFYRQSPIHTAHEYVDEVMHGQTLCGLVVFQHQARNDVVQMVEQLDYSCIRFIYFSKENELRSRVFAEKLGLEAGWNCHISLASEDKQLKAMCSKLDLTGSLCKYPAQVAMQRSATWSEHFPVHLGGYSVSSLENTFREFSNQSSNGPYSFYSVHRQLSSKSAASSKHSESHRSLYSWSDEMAPGLFPNKAKLPSGIKNIRPHLENVDNVPLLVSLFTDCDHFSNQEMIKIMQDYGEMVLVIGSSLNYFNGSILNQGNCSISIEPQYPALCSKDCLKSNNESKRVSAVATLLMGLCSDIVIYPNQTVNLISLISLCRHQLRMFRSSLLFFLFSSIALLMQQILSLLLLLPNVLSVFQIFLFIIIYVPLLALSLMASPHEHGENRDEIAPKNVASAPRRLMRRAIIYFSINFLPTQLFVSFIYYNTVVTAQKTIEKGYRDSLCSVSSAVFIARHVAAFYLLLYLCALSMGFVYFRRSCWVKIPLCNIYWVTAMCSVIVLQIAYTSLSNGSLLHFLGICNIWITAMSFLWIIIIIIVSELCKLHFIKLYYRDQRRRKLSFNTKLGMNSPY